MVYPIYLVITPCSSNPCQNGGTCTALSKKTYSCSCRAQGQLQIFVVGPIVEPITAEITVKPVCIQNTYNYYIHNYTVQNSYLYLESSVQYAIKLPKLPACDTIYIHNASIHACIYCRLQRRYCHKIVCYRHCKMSKIGPKICN